MKKNHLENLLEVLRENPAPIQVRDLEIKGSLTDDQAEKIGAEMAQDFWFNKGAGAF